MRYLLQALAACLIALILASLAKSYLETPKIDYGYKAGVPLVREDDAYFFTVPEAGSVLEFKFKTDMPDNTWKSVEFQVFGPDGSYLFTYFDELWTETGRDSEGFWRESKSFASLTQRFSTPGEYHALLSDTDGPKKHTNYRFEFRVTVLNGDPSFLKPVYTTLKILTGFLFLLFAISIDSWRKTWRKAWHYSLKSIHKIGDPRPAKPRPRLFLWLLGISLLLVFINTWRGVRKNTDPVQWVHVQIANANVTRERNLLGTSSIAADFRGGAGRGGK